MAMEEVSSNMTIAVIMMHLYCHEDAYLQRKTKRSQLSKKGASCFLAWFFLLYSLLFHRPHKKIHGFCRDSIAQKEG